MAEFNPNAYYSYPFKYKHQGKWVNTKMAIRPSDGMLSIGKKYYESLGAYRASKAYGRSSTPAQRVAEAGAITRAKADMSAYSTRVSAEQSARARKQSDALKQRMKDKSSKFAEARQLKKPEAGVAKIRKGAKAGGVATLKKPVAGVSI